MMHKSILVLGLLAFTAAPVLACLWDYDTLKDERRGLPGIAEVLAGKWEKHSRFFYEQRVAKMKALLEKDPNNLPAYDNLAVAHEKLDDQDAAIEVMLGKERIKPGEYTTYANLGTFYLHKGDFANGVAFIRKALEINPDAHFGREEYQLRLAEYYQEAKATPELLKTRNFLGIEVSGHDRSTNDALNRGPTPLGKLGLKENVLDGIVGMIRFGTGKSAELYYVLGELLAYRGDKHLAYRAYQRALDLNHPRADDIRKAMADVKEGVEDHRELSDELIARERVNADQWVSAYQAYENRLLRDGKDVDDEAIYAAFYREHGTARLADEFSVRSFLTRRNLVIAGIGAGIAFIVARVVFDVRSRRRRRAAAASE